MNITKLWPRIAFCWWTRGQWTNWFKTKSWTMKWESLYLIAEQNGILLTDKNTMSDIYFPLVRWVQLQTTWGYIVDAVHYLGHNRYTSLDVHLGANVFVTAESTSANTTLSVPTYYWYLLITTLFEKGILPQINYFYFSLLDNTFWWFHWLPQGVWHSVASSLVEDSDKQW